MKPMDMLRLQTDPVYFSKQMQLTPPKIYHIEFMRKLNSASITGRVLVLPQGRNHYKGHQPLGINHVR